ncbi:hypothetical protein [Streptomyces sp. NPDC058623]|uniref:hypothetical protein n=1 Tax=Streptomyces sp. NPDC058623 TaxID=3346563 RepID=UPI003655FF67
MTARELTTTWPDLLHSLPDGRDLPVAETSWAREQVMTGGATSDQLASLLVALRGKGGRRGARRRGRDARVVKHGNRAAQAAAWDPRVAGPPFTEWIGGRPERAAGAVDSGAATTLTGRWAEVSATFVP